MIHPTYIPYTSSIHKRLGFTVVELIIIIVVIAILASISVVGYGTWRTRIANTEAQSDLRQISALMKNKLNFDGTYPLTMPPTFQQSSGITLSYIYGDETSYCIEATSTSNSSVKYHISNASTDPKTGSCPTGVGPIAYDPTKLTMARQSGCAVLSGASWCWGKNEYYMFGSGTDPASGYSGPGYPSSGFYYKPVRTVSSGAMSGQTVTAVSAPVGNAQDHACAIASGKAYCWGMDWDGSTNTLGTGNGGGASQTYLYEPAKVYDAGVLSGKTIVQITTGQRFSCARSSDNMAFCWGASYGNIPIRVANSGVLSGLGVKHISAGTEHVCVIATDDHGYCWGANGRLGSGAGYTPYYSPVAIDRSGVLTGKTLKYIDNGSYGGCAIASDNHAYCWGNNGGYGSSMLGNSTSISDTPVPVDRSGALSGLTIKTISVGETNVCVLASDNKPYCWGSGHYGGLGNGSTLGSSVPVAVQSTGAINGKRLIYAEAGYHTSCVMTESYEVYCWGHNAQGKVTSGSPIGSDSSYFTVPTLRDW